MNLVRNCSINNPNKLCLLKIRAFWVKKELMVGQIILEKRMWARTIASVFVSPHNHYMIRRTG